MGLLTLAAKPGFSALANLGLGIAGLFDKGPKQSGIPDYAKMVESAKAAGLNPLEVLGTVAPDSFAGPRVASFEAMGNAFDMLEDALSGRQAKREKLIDVQTEIAEIERDGLLRGVGMNNRAADPEPIPLEVEAIDREGNVTMVPNPELAVGLDEVGANEFLQWKDSLLQPFAQMRDKLVEDVDGLVGEDTTLPPGEGVSPLRWFPRLSTYLGTGNPLN